MSLDQWKNKYQVNLENEKSIKEEEYNLVWKWIELRKFGESVRECVDQLSFSIIVKKSLKSFFNWCFWTFDTFRNYRSFINFSPALEYNFIPYSEVLTREITLAYKIIIFMNILKKPYMVFSIKKF